MNKIIRLSLATFMLLNASVINAQTALTNGIEVLANTTETINSNKTILSDTYQSPTDINHTGGRIDFGEKGKTHTISNINITSSVANNWLVTNGTVNFENVNLENTVTNANDGYLLILDTGNKKNNPVLNFNQGSIKNLSVNSMGSGNTHGNITLQMNNTLIDNVKFGNKPHNKGVINIFESEINNSYFAFDTFIENSTVNNIEIGEYTTTFDNSVVNGKMTLKDKVSIAIKNNSVINSDIIFGKQNSIIFDNSMLDKIISLNDDTSITIKNNSIINSNIVFGNNNNLTIDNANYEINKDLNLNNLSLISTEAKGDLIANSINIANSNIVGLKNQNLSIQSKNGHITLDTITANNTNIKIAQDKFLIFKGANTLNNINITNDLALPVNKHQIVITNNSNTTINDSIIKNSSINQNSSTEFNGKLVINNSEVIDTNIGVFINNNIYNRIPTLELNSVNYVNNLANSGIYARDIIVNGGYIKANELYGTDTEIMPEGVNDISTRNHTSITIKNNAVIDSKLDSEKLIIENSIINGDLHAIKNIDLIGAKITGDINADDLNATNTDINSSLVNITNNATINSASSNKVIGVLNIGNNFTSSNTEFSGNITTNNLLSDKNSTFKGEVVADSINAVGSIFDNTLTITGNSKNNILDNATLNQGINVDSKDASVSIVNGSNIKGAIKNEGTIIVDKDSTISHEVSGSGKLNTDSATYNDNVSMGSIEGSGNTFIKDVEITNKDSILNIGDNTFGGNIKVESGTINADSSFNLKDLTASNINIKNEDVNTKDKITANNVNASDTLIIENISVNTNQINAKQAQINNSNITSVFLKGSNDNAINAYDKTEITSGDYTVNNSAIKGAIRANQINSNASKFSGQINVNTLNASNSEFYITGGGYDTSLYTDFSGAIIARKGASGKNNIINISKTDLSKLVNGYVPIAIIGNELEVSRSDAALVGSDYFNVIYSTPVSNIYLADNVVSYKIINGKEVWSVGLAGDKLSEADIQEVLDGNKNYQNIINEDIDKNYKLFITRENFTPATQKEINQVAYNQYFLAKNLANNFDRFSEIRANDYGFWANSGYDNFATLYDDLKIKSAKVGIDNSINLERSSLAYGVFASSAILKSSSVKNKANGFGIYASTNFNNGVFADYSLAYYAVKNEYDLKNIDLKTSKNTNLWQAQIGVGHRIENSKIFFEPSVRMYVLKATKHNVVNDTLGIFLEQNAQVSLNAGILAGYKLSDNFDMNASLNYQKDLSNSSKVLVKSILDTNQQRIKNDELKAGIGLKARINKNFNLNINTTKAISTFSDTKYNFNLGLNYKF